ncbi:MAG: histidinol dehydrogenase [Acidobacteriota bacterium]
MKVYRFKDLTQAEAEELCRRNPAADSSVMDTCSAIFAEVERRGDEAVRRFTAEFDGAEVAALEVPANELAQAGSRVSRQALQALEAAAANIRHFHAAQGGQEPPVEVRPGVTCWREARAIESVGLYIPGGSAVLPSTVLMLAIPARLAGCSQVIICVPPRQDGSVSPEVLAAAAISGVSRVFKIGGAQAIAAMATGTESVPRVDKILGPGNRWVQAAKLLASLRGVATDMVAGPSEVLVIADQSACADFVAADLISQAEHGCDSQAILVSTWQPLIDEMKSRLQAQLADLPRRTLAAQALKHSFAVLAGTLEEALDFSNRYAPEHLILHVEDPQRWLSGIRSAGSVFLGPWSPEVAGDYASGTNHTLPTSGQARAISGVSLDSFVKKITFQRLTREGLLALAPTLETLADMEGLEGHRRAVRLRVE